MMGKHSMKRITKAAAAAVAAFFTHTSFATETVNTAGASAGAVSGAVAGSNAHGGAGGAGGMGGSLTSGNTRAYGLGLGAAVSPATCYGSILGGGAVTTQEDCLRFQWHQRMLAQAAATESPVMYTAARLYLCVNSEVAAAMREAGLPCPKAGGPRGPVFQTGTLGDGGYGPYRPYEN